MLAVIKYHTIRNETATILPSVIQSFDVHCKSVGGLHDTPALGTDKSESELTVYVAGLRAAAGGASSFHLPSSVLSSRRLP